MEEHADSFKSCDVESVFRVKGRLEQEIIFSALIQSARQQDIRRFFGRTDESRG
jgi:hypothetical protein